MTEDELAALAALPGINADLITERFNAGDLKYLISLFDFIQRSKNRAESLALVYQRQMFVLHDLLEKAKSNVINEPRPRRTTPAFDAKADAVVEPPKKLQKPTKGNIVTIDL